MHNVYEKTIINTNDQQFNQYKQNEQLSLTLKKKTPQKDHIHIPMEIQVVT